MAWLGKMIILAPIHAFAFQLYDANKLTRYYALALHRRNATPKPIVRIQVAHTIAEKLLKVALLHEVQ